MNDEKNNDTVSSGEGVNVPENGPGNNQDGKNADSKPIKNDSTPDLKGPGELQRSNILIQGVIIAALVAFFAIFIILACLGKNEIINQMASIKHARGLITFILAIGTMTIALLVTIGALMGRDKEAKDRFYRAKEILTILIGIMGTIVGYYYGTQIDTDTVPAKIAIENPHLSVRIAKPADEIILTTMVTGGKPIYNYKIAFTPKTIKEIKGKSDPRGWIQAKIKAAEVKEKTDVKYTLSVEDENKVSQLIESDSDNYFTIEPENESEG